MAVTFTSWKTKTTKTAQQIVIGAELLMNCKKGNQHKQSLESRVYNFTFNVKTKYLIMKLKFALILLFSTGLSFVKAQLIPADHEKVKGGQVTIQPITHATLVLSYQKTNIYIDPTGGAETFKGLAPANIILITDIHGDHFDPKTLEAVNNAKATLVVPQAVADIACQHRQAKSYYIK